MNSDLFFPNEQYLLLVETKTIFNMNIQNTSKLNVTATEHKSLMDLSQTLSYDSRIGGIPRVAVCNFCNNPEYQVNLIQQHLHRNTQNNVWPNIWTPWSSHVDA